jgi:hypothetical protein
MFYSSQMNVLLISFPETIKKQGYVYIVGTDAIKSIARFNPDRM